MNLRVPKKAGYFLTISKQVGTSLLLCSMESLSMKDV
jgi:hypothetical protein